MSLLRQFPQDRTRALEWNRRWSEKMIKYEWNADKRQYLIDNWEAMTDEELARNLDVSAVYITNKRRNMGLHHKRGRKTK